MIQVYSKDIAITPNSNVQFNTVALKTGSTVTMQDSTQLSINRSGIYRIEFVGYGASSTDNSMIGVQLVVDGKEVPQAEATVATSSAIMPEQIAFVALVPIKICPCGSKTVTVLATGTAGTLSLANITVTKIR